MEWLPPCPLEGPLHWVELPAPSPTAQPERAEHLLFILPLSICPSPHEARGVLSGRAGQVPALGPNAQEHQGGHCSTQSSFLGCSDVALRNVLRSTGTLS